MNKKIIIQHDFLLIDTCFLIDSYSHHNLFTDFLQNIKDDDCYLVTIPQVKFEFIRSKTKDVIEKKNDYFRNTIDKLLKTDRFDNSVESLIMEYGTYLDGVSFVDLYLGALVKQLRIVLFTRNHKDFPLTIFTRQNICHFELTNSILTYAEYSYGGIIKKEDSKEELPF